MVRRRKGTSQGFLSRTLDATISLLIKAMIVSFIIGAGLVVASEFYEPAIGKWSVAVAAPYALIVPVYFMKLALNFFERLTSKLLKN